jgi:uncharacterized membrane protein
MSFLAFLIVMVLFFYTLHRVSVLEQKVTSVLKTQGNLSEKITSTVPPSHLAEPVLQNDVPPSVVSAPQVAPLSPVLPERAPHKEGGTEFEVGSKVLTGIGILALFLGVAFFLRYAFENNLISPSMRVVFGAIFGVVVGVVGHFLRKKYPAYGYTLIGGGLGILYLVAYSAYAFYDLIGATSAFIALALITAVGVLGSVRYNSKPLVVYSLLGAYLIPFILPLSVSVHTLFGYLIVINAAVLLIARFKVWPELAIGAIFGTCLIYIKWVVGPYEDSLFIQTLAYTTILFLIYFFTSFLNFVLRNRDYKGMDAFLLYAVPIVYFFLNLAIVQGRNDIALFALSIGIFYIAIGIVIRTLLAGMGELVRFSSSMIFVGLPFIVGATALHFEGSAMTIAWAAEAAIMIAVGHILGTQNSRIGGMILAVLTGIKLLVSDLGLPEGGVMIFNARSATITAAFLMFAVMWWLYARSRSKGLDAEEANAGVRIGAIGAFVLLFVFITLEMKDFVTSPSLYIPIVWMIFSAFVVSVSFLTKEKSIRFLSYCLFILSFFFAVGAQWNLDLVKHASFFNIRVLTAFMAAAVALYLVKLLTIYRKDLSGGEEEIKNVFLAGANLLVLWAFTLEILGYYNLKAALSGGIAGDVIENTKRVVLSGFWLFYALVAVTIGIVKRSSFARYFSIVLFAITIFKIFLYDTANLSDVYRFISFILLGVILLITGFAYYKFRHRITEFVKVEPSQENSSVV